MITITATLVSDQSMLGFCHRVRGLLVLSTLVAAVSIGFSTVNLVAAEGGSGMYADLPGVRLWFTDSGGAGVPIVLLHANTGTSETWERQIKRFAEAGYRVIAFDRRGWGKSMADPQSGPQPGSIAGDLDALADRLRLDRFHLLGVAGGGFAALDYAAWRPARIRSLVIGASAGQVAEKEMTDHIAKIRSPELLKRPPAELELSSTYRTADPEGTKRWVELEEHARQPGAPDQPLNTPNTFAKLESIPAPTLVMSGSADLLSTPAVMRIWATHMRDVVWLDVPDAGHAIAWEQPDLFNAKVLEFIGRH